MDDFLVQTSGLDKSYRSCSRIIAMSMQAMERYPFCTECETRGHFQGMCEDSCK